MLFLFKPTTLVLNCQYLYTLEMNISKFATSIRPKHTFHIYMHSHIPKLIITLANSLCSSITAVQRAVAVLLANKYYKCTSLAWSNTIFAEDIAADFKLYCNKISNFNFTISYICVLKIVDIGRLLWYNIFRTQHQ